jgi:hypothetical protein
MITNIGLGCQLTKFHEFWWIYIFAGGYQNNLGIDIFHEKEPTSIGLISTSQIHKWLLEDTRGLHEEGHHEAPPGGADRPQP